MGQSPRSFSREFKEATVKRMLAGESPSRLSRELTIPRKLLYEWRDRYRQGEIELLRGTGRPPRSSCARDAEGWRTFIRRQPATLRTLARKPLIRTSLYF